jgi:hypothetical protein
MRELEARVSQLELMQDLLLRIISTTRPLCHVLEQFGATETQQQGMLKFLDGLVMRVRGPAAERPSKAYFDMHVREILPSLRDDQDFQQLLMDTLKVERPAYRELHDYMVSRGWLTQTEAPGRTAPEIR